MIKKIELLAPAKNIEIGMAAIRHGADAVYIGAESFGARFSASNSMSEIEKLVQYAHQYHAKVYLTLNTLLYEEEIVPAQKIAFGAYNVGVDALILQDFGLIEAGLPPMPLHASTQMHNFTVERINFLEKIGFTRVVLPRELSLNQIHEFRHKTNIELEYFVFGALCVSYSGQCYLSASNGGRSANRGNCAQPCRLPYDVLNKNKEIIAQNQHVLSLKDLNLEAYLPEIIKSGVSSLKIEGRLKSLPYVINVVGYFRKKLDDFLNGNHQFSKASSGNVNLGFEPNLNKTFNRGFTELNINGRVQNVTTLFSPKSMGEFIGVVTTKSDGYIDISTSEKIVNGDGLCFLNRNNELEGFVVNKVNQSRVYDNLLENCFIGAKIYRNKDIEFDRILQAEKTKRFIDVSISFDYQEVLTLKAIDENGISVVLFSDDKFELANQGEKAKKNIEDQFAKCGDTIFSLKSFVFNSEKIPFIRISDLNRLRRDLLDLLLKERLKCKSSETIQCPINNAKYPEKRSVYTHNLLNTKAQRFFEKQEVKIVELSAELDHDYKNVALMTTHHCLKFAFGKCEKYSQNITNQQDTPVYVRRQETLYQLKYDCKNCVMQIFNVSSE